MAEFADGTDLDDRAVEDQNSWSYEKRNAKPSSKAPYRYIKDMLEVTGKGLSSFNIKLPFCWRPVPQLARSDLFAANYRNSTDCLAPVSRHENQSTAKIPRTAVRLSQIGKKVHGHLPALCCFRWDPFECTPKRLTEALLFKALSPPFQAILR